MIEQVRAECEREIGHPLAIEFNTSASTRQRIQSGEAFDVAVLTSEVIDDLIKAKKIAEGTRADIGRTGVGIGARRGAPKADVASPEAVKRTLLNAKSLTYVQDGASRPPIIKMLDSLGITADVKSKTILAKGTDEATASVADGKVELVLTLISEILPARGVELLGPFPAKFQNYVSFAAGVSSSAKNAEAARALTKFLTRPALAPILKSKGMDPN